MAKYRITGPDGGTYEITAPDTASQDEVLAYAQANYKQPSQSQFSDVTASVQPSTEARYAAAGIDPTTDVTAGTSTAENLGAGFAKSFIDTGVGLAQNLTDNARRISQPVLALNEATGGMGQGIASSVDEWLAKKQAERQASIDETRRRDAPLMSTGGGLVGNVAGQAAQMAVPVGGAAKASQATGLAAKAIPYAAAASRAGAYAATQPLATGMSKLEEIGKSAAAGAAGQAVGAGIGRVGQGLSDRLSPVVQQSVEMARRAGIPLHMSQVTDSKALKTISSALSYLPFSGAGKAAQKQQEAFNRAVSKSFGADAATLSDDVMSAARKKLGDEFDRIYGANGIVIDPKAGRAFAAIEKEAHRGLPPDEAKIVSKQIDDILEMAESGEMTGRAYQAFRTDRLMPLEKGGPPFKANVIRAIRKELDDVASRSVGPSDAAALKLVRQQWANLRTTEDALKQVSGSSGNVRPASLWALIRKGSTKEMRELAKIGQNVLKDPIPDSGTAARNVAYSLLGLGGGGLAANSDNGTVSSLGKLLLAGTTLGRLANSPAAARYLTQGSGTTLNRLARLAAPAASVTAPATVRASEKKRP